jgi:hypothetical protein
MFTNRRMSWMLGSRELWQIWMAENTGEKIIIDIGKWWRVD